MAFRSERRTSVSQSVTPMSQGQNLSEKLARRTEQQLESLRIERSSHELRADSADERAREMLQLKDALEKERSRLQEALATTQAENRGMADTVRRMEQQVKQSRDEHITMQARLDAAAEQRRVIEEQRDVLREEKAEALQQLASVAAHKAGVEELAKRAMAQLKALHEEKLALAVRADTSEQRCQHILAQREGVQLDVGKAGEHNAVLQAEKRGLESAVVRLEQQLQEERTALQARVQDAEEHVRSLLQFKDATHEERRKQLEQIAVLHSEKQALAELLKRCEDQSRAAQAASTERCGALEARAIELDRQKVTLRDELAAVQERLASVEGEKRGLEQLKQQLQEAHAGLLEEKRAEQTRADSEGHRCADGQRLLEECRTARAETEQQLAVIQVERKADAEASARVLQQLSDVQRDKGEVEARLRDQSERRELLECEKNSSSADMRTMTTRITELEAMSSRAHDEVCALQAEREELESIAQQVHAVTGRMMPGGLPGSSRGTPEGFGYA